jgi:PAS domain-containing protein
MDEHPLTLLLEYLDDSPQPTFVLRLSDVDSEFTHANPALQQLGHLHINVLTQFRRIPAELKHNNNTGDASRRGSTALQVSFCDLDWTVKTVGKQWLVISTTDELGGSRKVECPSTAQSTNATTLIQRPPLDLIAPTPGQLQTTNSVQRPPLGAVATQGHLGDLSYLEWMREFDWASSPIGPIEQWPTELRQICEHILASPDPNNILWGDDCIFLYNKAFSIMVGDKHPCAMGRPFKENFPQWPEYYRIFDRMRETGESVQQEKVRRVLERDGQLEEAFFEFVLTPILAVDGFVAGFSTRVRVVTRQVIFERRMQLLTETNKAIATTYDVQDLCTAAVDVASMYRSDVHFAAIYSTGLKDHTIDLTLEGTAGLRAGFEGPSPPGGFEPLRLDLNDVLLEACRTRKSIILSTSDGTLKQSTLDQLSRYGVSPCREVVIQPLLCFVEDNIAAVMIIGTSPLRPFDEDYRSFLQLMKSQIENGITVVRGMAREKELHRAQLNSELERRFWRFAAKAPVGMYMYSADDVLTFWNAAFEGICGVSGHDLKQPLAWMDTVHPDGLADITAVWESYTKSRCDETITFEVQFKKPWTHKHKHGDGEASLDRTYALGILQPEYNEDGTLKGTLGCITDISLSKWAEKMQSAQLAEAIEQKRQQENFLDVTSHEMSTFCGTLITWTLLTLQGILSMLSSNAPTS